jgi:hypothetical protein
MSWARSTNGRRGMHVGFWWESQKERDHYENLHVGGRIVLQLILVREYGVVWTGLIWLQIATSGCCCEHGNDLSSPIKYLTILE